MPIYTRITVDGKRIELTTGRFIDISKWSVKEGKMIGSSREAKSINEQLEVIRLGVRDAQIELTYKKIALTASSLKGILTGTQERARTLIPIFLDHNNRIKEPLCEVSGFRKLYSKLS